MSFDYYSDHLTAGKLRRAYEIAPPRVKRYLRAELAYVLDHIDQADHVIELGCGYGRILGHLADHAGWVLGIDSSVSSLWEVVLDHTNLELAAMDAVRLALADNSFDVVVCIQNGISAFHVDHGALLRESLRIARPGGRLMFSSYSPKFWEERLHWFELQAEEGLVGLIDYGKTGDGTIVCRDGFSATTVTEADFRGLLEDVRVSGEVVEVDHSSVFLHIRKP